MATQEQTEQVKRITESLENTYQNLRKVARNISGLLAVNRATCDEIKAYNLYAMSVYDAQRGMLTNLRANGVTDAPALPQSPTLFAWKGVAGEDAFTINCTGEETSLSGALARALSSTADPN